MFQYILPYTVSNQTVNTASRMESNSQKNRSRAEGANWNAKTLGEVSEQLNDSLEIFRLSGAVADEEPAEDKAAEPVNA